MDDKEELIQKIREYLLDYKEGYPFVKYPDLYTIAVLRCIADKVGVDLGDTEIEVNDD